MVIEKRKERRIRASLPIKIVYRGLEIDSRTENISRLGAYAEINRDIPVGSDIDITLKIPVYKRADLPLSGEVKCRAAVFRSHLAKELNPEKYYGVGMFFTDFERAGDKNKLSEYIEFLVLQEEKGVREDLKRWRKKRGMNRNAAGARKIKSAGSDYQAESINLLKQVLGRIEEIRRLLKARQKSG